jgi:hypothetical protein
MKKTLILTLLISLLVGGYSLVSAQSDAELELKPSVTQANVGDEFSVDIVLKNPGAETVISVRSWLEYDATALEATNIDTSASSFTLSAPGEDDISSSEGRVKIGRSNIAGGVTDKETTVAIVKFKVLSSYKANTEISFYDYQVSELGHTSVNIIDSGFPLNILAEEPDSLSISLNPSGTVETTTTVTPPVTTTTTTVTPPVTTTTTTGVGGPIYATSVVQRPTNLKANTGTGYVDLKWDASSDASIVGYNIYYGKVSGQYSRRRSIGNFNSYRMDGLTSNETYYLAVTAYDQVNQESDYSNEVGIIVGQPLSSTHPFQTLIQQAVASIPVQPQNGPLVGWVLFSAAGLSGAMVFGRKRRKIEITNK